MAKKPVCLVCQKEMEVGYFLDRGHSTSELPRWFAGEPKPVLGELLGVAPKGRQNGCVIVAYRCPECEALRLYAPSTQDHT